VAGRHGRHCSTRAGEAWAGSRVRAAGSAPFDPQNAQSADRKTFAARKRLRPRLAAPRPGQTPQPGQPPNPPPTPKPGEPKVNPVKPGQTQPPACQAHLEAEKHLKAGRHGEWTHEALNAGPKTGASWGVTLMPPGYDEEEHPDIADIVRSQNKR
jgi:hypothetical protein